MDHVSRTQTDSTSVGDDLPLWREHYRSFTRLYHGRDDIIAHRRDGRYVDVAGEGLTLDRFRAHVEGRETYAIYNRDDAGMVRFGLFDLDIFPRDQGWDNLLRSMPAKKEETLRLVAALGETGLQADNLLVEFPTVGYHVLIFFTAPVPAGELKAAMAAILDRCHLADVPFYPRNLDGPWGDRIQLPLRVNLNTGRRSNFVADLATFDPLHYPDDPDFLSAGPGNPGGPALGEPCPVTGEPLVVVDQTPGRGALAPGDE